MLVAVNQINEQDKYILLRRNPDHTQNQNQIPNRWQRLTLKLRRKKYQSHIWIIKQ